MLRTFTRASRTFRVASVRPFSQSATHRAEGNASTNAKTDTSMPPDGEHSVNKAKRGDTHDVRASMLSDGLGNAKQGTGGTATEERDSAGGMQKAKEEFPESPDPAIGMQDERGGRGGR
ncbi:uncharacterized protein M421DRAFT_421482 [Didymella exigua CBS 183.55]|uniref:Uncharacterized protein n=1 Tax=Didymella exigua CBS 183.55 TaxID=1150837 RepID=A0A6A5RQ70_9PLEO|nr:uncharacterized protein M421DRAFT_421482 [Didymella exigua CBS 183.55]KAF1927637.1 hypothetical protein M421DRAFT_421482 [Didymella exigua CBS 183.55]